MKINNKKLKGFGIVEVLIASSIIIVFIFSLTAVARASLNSTSRTAERVQAMYLAQSAIETVREIRDTNWIDGKTSTVWNTLVFDGTNWLIPTYGQSHAIGRDSASFFYYLDPTKSSEQITLADNSVFTREVVVSSVGTNMLSNVGTDLNRDNYAFRVTVRVVTPHNATIQISEMITNWRPNY